MPSPSLVQRLKDRKLGQWAVAYLAGAWVVVEIASFVASTYGLDRIFVDMAVLLAVSGGVASAIIWWFHGKPGVQEFIRKEKILLGALGVLTLAGVVFLMMPRDPFGVFHRLDGQRLVLQFPLPPPELSDSIDLRWGPPEGSEPFREEGMVAVSPEYFRLDMPGVSVRAEGHPVKFEFALDSEAGLLAFALPVLPSDVLSLLELGPQHDSALVETGGLSMLIQRPFTLLGTEDSVTVRVEGRFSF